MRSKADPLTLFVVTASITLIARYQARGASLVAQCRELPCQEAALSPASGRSPAVGNDNPLQYSCLGNPTD